MRISCADDALAKSLEAVVPDCGPGLVYAAPATFGSWSEAENELVSVFGLTQKAAAANGPVVYIVDVHSLIGRAAPLDSAVATGLLAGIRGIAFERRRYGGYASMVATSPAVAPSAVVEAVQTLLTTRASNGQPFILGSEHLGAALP